MKIQIYGNTEHVDTWELFQRVNYSIEELGLNDFITVEISNDAELKDKLSITKEPALIIEEESIDFQDMIFEWVVPETEELSAMFISIIGWSSWWCDSWGCGHGCHGCL